MCVRGHVHGDTSTQNAPPTNASTEWHADRPNRPTDQSHPHAQYTSTPHHTNTYPSRHPQRRRPPPHGPHAAAANRRHTPHAGRGSSGRRCGQEKGGGHGAGREGEGEEEEGEAPQQHGGSFAFAWLGGTVSVDPEGRAWEGGDPVSLIVWCDGVCRWSIDRFVQATRAGIQWLASCVDGAWVEAAVEDTTTAAVAAAIGDSVRAVQARPPHTMAAFGRSGVGLGAREG